METKKCKVCLIDKELNEFYVVRGKPTPSCRSCTKERVKNYQKENREKSRAWKQKWNKENIERKRKMGRDYANSEIGREKQKIYKEKNKEARRQYINKWASDKRKDPKYRLDLAISHGIRDHLRCCGISKNKRKWEDIVGYTKQDLIIHIESLFKEGMTWDNYGSYWHIDHIRPKSWFKYTSMDDEEFKECWALSNLQPLEASINCSKGNKYEG